MDVDAPPQMVAVPALVKSIAPELQVIQVRPPTLKANLTKVSCGWQHNAVLTATGSVLTWGWGGYSSLGHGNTKDVATPLRIESLKSHVITFYPSHPPKVKTHRRHRLGQLPHGRHLLRRLPLHLVPPPPPP
jgi:hypothetical protein